ncbi:unnamed protein product, partial [Polarella glacialis]
PESKDGRRPVITEIGWTVTPPGSSAQTVHADILCWQSKDAHPRKQGLGRFHHILWKPDRKSLCTTKIVPKAFTEGCVQDFHYDKLSQVSSNSIIIDSEVLHCGNSAPIGSWVSTCTIQVSSESGWKALQAGGRVSEDLLWYVCPIQEAAGSNKRSRSSSTDGASNSSRGTDSGPPPMFAVGSKVQVLWEDCQWYDAEVTKFRRKDKTYTVNWEHEDSSSRALPACELRERPSRAKEELVVARAKEERVVVVAKAELTGRAKEEKGSSPVRKRPRLEEQEQASLPPRKRARADAEQDSPTKLQQQRLELSEKGLLLLPDGGLPWRWEMFDFVEECHTRFAGQIEAELEALRAVWMPVDHHSSARPGAFAAAQVSKKFKRHGIAVYAGPPSQRDDGDYEVTGPRFYVSLTRRAMDLFGKTPPIPRGLQRLLWPDAEDSEGTQRLRGLGWALAPPGSDPQQLHADIWGGPKHPKRGRIRFPHILWKSAKGAFCTTQVVPGGFTEGVTSRNDYERLVTARSCALVFDSEVLHRGGAVPKAPLGSVGRWASSCSLEFCSASGWTAWQGGTEGTVADPSDEEWAMLPVAARRPALDQAAEDAEEAEQERTCLLREATSQAALRSEQRLWEASS